MGGRRVRAHSGVGAGQGGALGSVRGEGQRPSGDDERLVPARWDGAGAGLRLITITGWGGKEEKKNNTTINHNRNHRFGQRKQKSNHKEKGQRWAGPTDGTWDGAGRQTPWGAGVRGGGGGGLGGGLAVPHALPHSWDSPLALVQISPLHLGLSTSPLLREHLIFTGVSRDPNNRRQERQVG